MGSEFTLTFWCFWVLPRFVSNFYSCPRYLVRMILLSFDEVTVRGFRIIWPTCWLVSFPWWVARQWRKGKTSMSPLGSTCKTAPNSLWGLDLTGGKTCIITCVAAGSASSLGSWQSRASDQESGWKGKLETTRETWFHIAFPCLPTSNCDERIPSGDTGVCH